MTAYCCGTPVKEDGTYYCPSCGYESKDIEKFAVRMCWKCVFPETEEETMGISTSKLSRGDRVSINKEVTVNSISVSGKGFYATDGNYYCNQADIASGVKGGYTVSLIEKAAPPEWPPQAGDIWRIDTGAEYACLNQYGTDAMYRTDDGGTGILYKSEMRKKNPVLVYRRGIKTCETKS